MYNQGNKRHIIYTKLILLARINNIIMSRFLYLFIRHRVKIGGFMKIRKHIASALVVGLCLVSASNKSFAGSLNDKWSKDKIVQQQIDINVIQQQIDAFDALDQQISRNRSTVVQADKDSSGLTRAGTYPTRKGVILVTRDGKLDKLVGHAGIVYNSSTTVEAFPKSRAPKNTAGKIIDGVSTYSNKWHLRYNKVYGVTTSGTTLSQDASVADYAYSYRNKPYNWTFTNTETTSKFY